MASLWEPVSGVYWSSPPLLPNMEWLVSLGNSSFFTTIFGALAGAFAGAWAAQRIAERSKLREELQKEIRSINVGITLALTTANLALALKKQHIRALKESYDADCERHKEYVQNFASGKLTGPFEITPNLLSFQELSPPIITLQEVVLGRLSTAGRALAGVSALADAFGSLNFVINKRNALIERMKEGNLPEGARIEHFYLGISYVEGKTSNEYGSFVQAMATYTDDAIFFSLMLCKDLQKHGAAIAQKHKKKFGGEIPHITPIDLKEAEEEGLLPREDEYEKWLSGFRSLAKEKTSLTALAEQVVKIMSFLMPGK